MRGRACSIVGVMWSFSPPSVGDGGSWEEGELGRNDVLSVIDMAGPLAAAGLSPGEQQYY